MPDSIYTSPISHLPLYLSNSYMVTSDRNESYPIINGIPIFLTNNTTADWHRELMEILLWQYPSELTKLYETLDWSKDVIPFYIETISRILHDKSGIIKAIETYISSATDSWIVENNGEVNNIPQKELNFFPQFTSITNGKVRIDNNRKPDKTGRRSYARDMILRNIPDNASILELATGAGGGTTLIADSLQDYDNIHLYTVDIGYSCLGNAVGIAKYLDCNDRIHPICANFWHLPFADNSFSAIYTNFGLDESREINLTITEVARILQPNCVFVNVSRKSAFLRQQRILEPFGFDEYETIDLLKRAKVYSNIDNLDELCEEHGLTCENVKIFEDKFAVSTFRKTS